MKRASYKSGIGFHRMPLVGVPQTSPNGVEVVVVTRNSAEHIGPCLRSICETGALPVVVDNASADNTLAVVRGQWPQARVIASPENLGYGRALNLGFKEITSGVVILANPDVIFLEGSIQRMASFLYANPNVGLTGPQQRFPNGGWQRSYGDLPGLWAGIKDAVGITTVHNTLRRLVWPRRIDRRPKYVPYVDGAVLAVRREAFLDVGGFDEEFFFYSEEADLCGRIRRADWKVVFLPDAEVIHLRGASSAKEENGSDNPVQLLVKGQALLASKCLPGWKVRAYARLQVAHFARLALTYRMLRLLAKEGSSAAQKIRMFDTYKRVWADFL